MTLKELLAVNAPALIMLRSPLVFMYIPARGDDVDLPANEPILLTNVEELNDSTFDVVELTLLYDNSIVCDGLSTSEIGVIELIEDA